MDAVVGLNAAGYESGKTHTNTDAGEPLSLHRLLMEDKASKDDKIPRPPHDPLTTGQKMESLVDGAGAIGGSYFAVKKFREQGLHVIRADIQSLDKLVGTPELADFRSLGSSMRSKTSAMYGAAQENVAAMQAAKPHLFDEMSSIGTTFKGTNLKVPKYAMMDAAEQGVIDRASNLGYINESLRRGVNTTNTANFRSGLKNIIDLHKNPTAVAEGLSPELMRLEALGSQVSNQASKSTITMASESRAVLFKNAGIVGAGLATNYIIENTLLKNSAPSRLTIATDVASPFVVLTDLPLWAKFSVIVGAHALSRLAEYGMRKGGE